MPPRLMGEGRGNMSDLSTALRAFLTRRLDPVAVYSYVLLFGLVVVVVVTGAMVVANQLRDL
jgi:hypothetical protein